MEHQRDKLEKLFEEWIKYDKNKGYIKEESEFVKDGIIADGLWSNAKTKVLFICKEPEKCLDITIADEKRKERISKKEADSIRTICDLFNIILKSKEPGLGHFNTLGRWAYTIHNRPNLPSFKEAGEEQNRCDAFRSSAFMNIRKISGGPNTDEKRLQDYADKHRYYIRGEIENIKPYIIVCCGEGKARVINIIARSLELETPIKNGSPIKERGMYLLSMPHPSSWNSREVAFEKVKKMVKKIPLE